MSGVKLVLSCSTGTEDNTEELPSAPPARCSSSVFFTSCGRLPRRAKRCCRYCLSFNTEKMGGEVSDVLIRKRALRNISGGEKPAPYRLNPEGRKNVYSSLPLFSFIFVVAVVVGLLVSKADEMREMKEINKNQNDEKKKKMMKLRFT